MRASTRSGRISFVVLAGVVSVAMVAVLLLFNGQSPRTTAAEFMTALSKGDVDTLTNLSVVGNKNKDQIHQEWERSIKYGRTYLFFWNITNVSQSGNTATVRVELTANPQNQGSYEEPKPLTLVKDNGVWKVDVTQITRDAFPFLPQ